MLFSMTNIVLFLNIETIDCNPSPDRRICLSSFCEFRGGGGGGAPPAPNEQHSEWGRGGRKQKMWYFFFYI